MSDHVSAALVVLAAIAMAVFALRRKREDTLQALGDAAADILREEARHIARRTLLRYGLGGVALVALGSWGWGSLQADMSPRTTTTWYNDATDTPSGLGAPDPTQLPTMLTGNPIDPVWAQFVDHALGSKAAGYSYTDTTSGALVTKLTDDTLPYSGGLGFGSMYSDGGTYISHPWGDNGDMFTIAIWQGDDTRTWLVDYQIGGTVSNYREVSGVAELGACLSSVSNTPRIAYFVMSGSLRRYDTAGDSIAESGTNFPHTLTSPQGSPWLNCSASDSVFVWHTTSGAGYWNQFTNATDTIACTLNEPRMERNGRYVACAQQSDYPTYNFQIWDIEQDTLSAVRSNSGKAFAHNANLRGYFVSTDWDNGGYHRIDPTGSGQGAATHTMDKMCFDDLETHLSGAWSNQGSGTDQWYVAASMHDGGWNNATYVLGHFAVCMIRADGSDARLVAHTGSNNNTASYWSLPFANISPSGHLVIWTSRNSTNGTNANNDYSLYVAEIPRA